MKNVLKLTLLICLSTVLFLTCSGDDNGNSECTESTWYQDADGDGLGNPAVSQEACEQPEGYVANNTDTDDSSGGDGLHAAFAEFDEDNTDIMLSGTNVIIETNGLPNHTSPYWSNTTERCATPPMGGTICTNSDTTVNHPLFVEPTVTTHEMMAPGNIDDFNGAFSLTVSANPQLAASSTATGLGPIGISISGSVIYNDEEGPGVPLDSAVGSLDYTAAHTGPQSYHYHLEPKAWSDDDTELIGIISDGFFIYGRKCASTGTYPTDLDASGGHTSTTQHADEAEYHYHIQNELYLGQFYILFPGDYQGTPNNIQ
ncbi:YHYH protein [Lacinutrix iliipiscaria]|uniref:YHYH protein n=1 Tax=Lacinutrix iliipiscaria TaxID=1230532 RepID=A0ABW5WP08_9FLAO